MKKELTVETRLMNLKNLFMTIISIFLLIPFIYEKSLRLQAEWVYGSNELRQSVGRLLLINLSLVNSPDNGKDGWIPTLESFHGNWSARRTPVTADRKMNLRPAGQAVESLKQLLCQ